MGPNFGTILLTLGLFTAQSYFSDGADPLQGRGLYPDIGNCFVDAPGQNDARAVKKLEDLNWWCRRYTEDDTCQKYCLLDKFFRRASEESEPGHYFLKVDTGYAPRKILGQRLGVMGWLTDEEIINDETVQEEFRIIEGRFKQCEDISIKFEDMHASCEDLKDREDGKLAKMVECIEVAMKC